MLRNSILILLLLPALFLDACDRPECRNTNAVFDRFTPESKEYKAELAKQVQRIGAGKLRYWYDGYREEGGHEYIIANIQGNGLCAKGELLVTDWAGIEGLRGAEANGYEGAELSGLRLAITEDAGGAAFIFKGLDSIID
jgi:hypothetical protein